MIRQFALRLADAIFNNEILVYFDSASFNTWVRPRYSWSYYHQPIHIVLQQNRCQNISVLGAISAQFNSRPLLMQAETTNSASMVKFLEQLRLHVPLLQNQKITMVLDNASVHSDRQVTAARQRLNIEFMFLPAYTPELNSIERLWSVIKKDFKRRLALAKFEKLDQTQFGNMLQKSLDMVTKEMQAKAATQNNREFLERLWNRELAALKPASQGQRLQDAADDGLGRDISDDEESKSEISSRSVALNKLTPLKSRSFSERRSSVHSAGLVIDY